MDSYKETGEFDPSRAVQTDELPNGYMVVYQDAENLYRPLEKTAWIMGSPVPVEE